jgi:hypothetical protein
MKKGYNQHKETAGEIESSEGDDRTYTFASQWHKGRPVEQKTKGGNMLATYRLLQIFQLGSPRKTDPTKWQVSYGKFRKKLIFGGLDGVHFPGPTKVANCQSAEDYKK